MRDTHFIAAALVVLASSSASAAIFRCTGADGSVTYQEAVCPAEAVVKVVNVPSSYPPPDREARDRLFQREAALEARLLKRAELDTAERIAREDRLAREAARQPDLVTALPVFVVGRMPFPARPLHRPQRILRTPL